MSRRTRQLLFVGLGFALTTAWLIGCGGGMEQSPVEDDRKILEESLQGAAPPGVDPDAVDMEAIYQGGGNVDEKVFEEAQKKLYKGYPGMEKGPQQ